MQDIIKARRDLTRTLTAFESQANRVYADIVVPSWNTPPWRNRLPHVLYGCVMWCFAWVDRLSAYWEGDANPKGQSKRMVDFMNHYAGYRRREASVAVKLWRHTLMHTAEPRELRDPKTCVVYSWLLHWGPQLSRDQHLTFTGSARSVILNMAMLYLLEDLKDAQRKYLLDLRQDQKLAGKFRTAERQMTVTEVKFY